MTYSALVSTPSSSVSSETPVHTVSSFDHLVTQWMSFVTVSLGRAWNSCQLHDTGSSTAPWIVKLHQSSGWCGVGPAESTGKSSVTYCPGGTRASSTPSRLFPWKPREIIRLAPGKCATRPPPAGAQRNSLPLHQLRPHHPELLLEVAHDLDQDVLRREVELAEAVHPRPYPLARVGEPAGELAHDGLGFDRTRVDGIELLDRGDRPGLPVRRGADRDGPLGDGVSEAVPRFDELVELEVKRPEQRSDDVPVQLLADEGQVEQLDQRRLQLV